MKLHELLAVEGNLENQSKKTTEDLGKTFNSKRHLFEEKRSVFKPFSEGEPDVVEHQSDIQTTVVKELSWAKGFFVKSLDASLQVAEANTRAKADIILDDGTIVAKDVPATFLLELEKRIAEFTGLLKNVPTLDPAKGFNVDSEKGNNIYQARPVSKQRTKKTNKVLVLYPATPEHPAQTQLVVEDVPVGTILEQEWSSMVTPHEKSRLIAKAEELERAVRQARSRANAVEVSNDKIGDALFKVIFGS